MGGTIRIATSILLVLFGSALIVRGVWELLDGVDQRGHLIGAFLAGPFLVVLGFRVLRGRPSPR